MRRRVMERRARVAEMYARYCREGNPHGIMTRIADELGVDKAQITRDMQALEADWRETAQSMIAATRAQLIADIHRDLNETREEWLRSRTDTPTEDVIEGTPGADGKMQADRMQRRKRSASADTRYLSAMTAMRDQLAKLLGAYAPDKLAPTTPDGQHAYDPSVDYRTELARRIDALAARLGSPASPTES